MRKRTRRAAFGLALIAAVTTVTAAVAADLEPDGVHLEAEFAGGGDAELELEDRSTLPVICFIWQHPAPQDGDSIASRILTEAGVEVVDLGSADQWVEGAAGGCEIPTEDRYTEVFANPEDFVVEFRVVENQGTPPTPPVRSGPLQPS